MEPRAHHVAIGVFVLFLAAIGIGVALWLGDPHSDRDYLFYRVKFDEPVTGLTVGSPVQYSGITVGQVVSLSLSPEDPRRAIARVRIDASIPIRQDTRAELAITSITGSAVIELSDGGPQVPLLSRKPDEEPLILAPRSALASLISGDGNSMTALNGILLRTQELLSKDNLALVHRTLVNMEQTTSSIADQRAEIAALIANLSEASRQSTEVLRQANSTVRDAGAMVNGDGRQAMASTREAAASLERSSARIEALLQNNQASLDQGMAATGPAMHELRQVLVNLNTVVRRLDNDPAGYLLGKENIEETQP
ncbi:MULTISPECIES: MlaD family protein [Pseudomonadota]|jgi:phospholipid/cholesterol/gamma-HCH transport system substrate-binding protein|uniref:MlaD family protein n=1 Tax=Pseudomonadota TaxID=1224 RepID=UPI001B6CADCC|nr:MlaD family protein [Achromobacter xylosoxidans]MBP7655164.1 MCE family protein [Pseudoxanthomonas sp.]MCH4578075.1 MlaD family protein [Achromobacter xylosoxidans]